MSPSRLLPPDAERRLREQARKQGTPDDFFTSDLSANEMVLVSCAGFEPLGQVLGSSIYHVGFQTGLWWRNKSGMFELEVLTEAFREARHLALARLQAEAELLGATGVVGVRLEHKSYEWGPDLMEFSAVGTAVRAQGQLAGRPALSSLSGQDFYALASAGWRPVGIAVGNCTYCAFPTLQTRRVMRGSGLYSVLGAFLGGLVGSGLGSILLGPWGGAFGAWAGLAAGGVAGFVADTRQGTYRNQELHDLTQALYEARERAMIRLESDAHALGAQGVVGVELHVDARPHRDDDKIRYVVYHFTAIGTAIAPGGAERSVDVSPTLRLDRRPRQEEH